MSFAPLRMIVPRRSLGCFLVSLSHPLSPLLKASDPNNSLHDHREYVLPNTLEPREWGLKCSKNRKQWADFLLTRCITPHDA